VATNFKGKVLNVQSSIFKSRDRRLSISVVTKAQVAQINALWADAINTFISAAVKSMAVDTGMSVSSFYSIAKSVGLGAQKIEGLANMKRRGMGAEAVASAEASKKRDSRRGYTDITGKWISGGSKSAATGRSLGEKAYVVSYVSPSKGVAVFQFEVVVWQHAATMKESLQIGANAMNEFIDQNFSKYLNPAKALRTALNI
jgi:hypothetical protein